MMNLLKDSFKNLICQKIKAASGCGKKDKVVKKELKVKKLLLDIIRRINDVKNELK